MSALPALGLLRVLMEDMGFSDRGQAWKDIPAGDVELGGRLPVNADGGLKSFGHPVADIEDVIPGFAARARVPSTVVTRDEWPTQRAVAGFDLPPATPLANLWNVGTTACAEMAKLVDQITARFPPRSGPVAGA